MSVARNRFAYVTRAFLRIEDESSLAELPTCPLKDESVSGSTRPSLAVVTRTVEPLWRHVGAVPEWVVERLNCQSIVSRWPDTVTPEDLLVGVKRGCWGVPPGVMRSHVPGQAGPGSAEAIRRRPPTLAPLSTLNSWTGMYSV